MTLTAVAGEAPQTPLRLRVAVAAERGDPGAPLKQPPEGKSSSSLLREGSMSVVRLLAFTQEEPSVTAITSPEPPEPPGPQQPSPALRALLALYWLASALQNVWLYLFTRWGGRTNHIMLAYRTVRRDLQQSPHNLDHLAARFRDALMPNGRAFVHHRLPWLLHIYRWFLQSPIFGAPGIVDFVCVRTRWFDQEVLKAIRERGIKQVVVIAAGFDTRAYRLGSLRAEGQEAGLPQEEGVWESIRVFEVDLPSASRSKQELVAKLGLLDALDKAPVYVAADLASVPLDEALKGTGFDSSAPTLFTLEGLLYYLPPTAVQGLFERISSMCAPGSRVVFDLLDHDVFSGSKIQMGYHAFRLTVRNKSELLRSGLPSESHGLQRFLREHGGLRLRDLVGPRELAEKLLPGTPWSPWCPPIAPYFHYGVAEKTGPIAVGARP